MRKSFFLSGMYFWQSRNLCIIAYIKNHIFKSRNTWLHYRFVNWPKTIQQFKMKIFVVLLISLNFVVCSRIECDWATQFLCGDQCLSIGKTCHCGNYNFAYKHALSYYCCQKPNTSCKIWNGDIACQGQVLSLNKPCNGSCRQDAQVGYTMLPCDDQNECYLGIIACGGKPQCKE